MSTKRERLSRKVNYFCQPELQLEKLDVFVKLELEKIKLGNWTCQNRLNSNLNSDKNQWSSQPWFFDENKNKI